MKSENDKKTNSDLDFDFDPVLVEIGEFGRYQIIFYALICIPIALHAAITLTYVFTAGNLQYRCKIPGCDQDPVTNFAPEWLQNVVPFDNNNQPSNCMRYAEVDFTKNEQCSKNDHFNVSEVYQCDEFVFSNEEVTIVNAFNLTCGENDWKIAAVGSINNAALFVFLPFMGIISDRYGRRAVFVWSIFSCGLFGVLKAFATNYPTFVVLEFVEAGLGAGSFIGAYVIGMELLGASKRAFGGTVMMCCDALGHVLLGFIAMYMQNFRNILLSLHAPAMLFLVYLWILPESSRWLMVNGRKNEAIRNIYKMAKINGVDISETTQHMLEAIKSGLKPMATISSVLDKGTVEKQEKRDKDRVHPADIPQTSIWQSRVLIFRILNCSLCWFAVAFVDYGLTLNSVNLGGNKYINFILSTSVEIPATALMYLLMDRIGRKSSQSGSMIISGVACLAAQYLTHRGSILQLSLFLIGKLSICMSFCIIYMYTAELFPTTVRNGIMSVCSMSGKAGSVLATQIPIIVKNTSLQPLLIFAIASIFSGIMILQLPETRNIRLPDTVEEAVMIGKQKELKVDSNRC